VRADVAQPVDVVGEDAALLVKCHRGAHHAVPSLIVGQKRLAAIAGPLDRPSKAPRSPDHHELLCVQVGSRPEATAHIRTDDMNGRRSNIECVSQRDFLEKRSLAA
jgi:hypothetical protein